MNFEQKLSKTSLFFLLKNDKNPKANSTYVSELMEGQVNVLVEVACCVAQGAHPS